LAEVLLKNLGDRYQVALGQRRYAVTPPGAAEQQEDYLEIRQRPGGRLVSLLDLVSPANKTTVAGRQAYLDLRRQAKAAGASVVEIDLVLEGQPLLDYSREGLPDRGYTVTVTRSLQPDWLDWAYTVTVTRSTPPDRCEVYAATLHRRLPRFRLPLAPEDQDAVLDLQAAFGRAYEAFNGTGHIDYRRDPPIPLAEEDHRWLDALLVEKGLREPPPSDDAVALAAYRLWEQEGRPHGRDHEHWQKALARLRHEAKPKTEGG
jgi:hypothetical protein